MPPLRSLVLCAAVSTPFFATPFFATHAALAQPSGQDVATAQALFEEGRRLMQSHKYPEACRMFAESQRLDPGGGTLLAIGLCHEAEGKTASAWADFNVAAGEARKDRRSDREATALDHVRALEPKLTRLKIIVAARVDGLEVRRDGAIVGDVQWGTPLPIDPGEHLFEARAPRKKAWHDTIAVRGEGQTVEVRIPALEEDPAAPEIKPPVPDPKVPDPNSKSPPPVPPASTASTANRHLSLALIAGGVGITSSVVGAVFGASAISKWSDAKNACPNLGCRSETSVRAGHDAGVNADLSTVFFVIGGAGLAASVILYVTGIPSSKEVSRVQITPLVTGNTAGLSVGGSL